MLEVGEWPSVGQDDISLGELRTPPGEKVYIAHRMVLSWILRPKLMLYFISTSASRHSHRVGACCGRELNHDYTDARVLSELKPSPSCNCVDEESGRESGNIFQLGLPFIPIVQL